MRTPRFKHATHFSPDLKECWVWVACFIVAAKIATAGDGDTGLQLINNILSINLIQLIAIFALFQQLNQLPKGLPASGMDYFVLVTTVPFLIFTGMAGNFATDGIWLTILGICLLYTHLNIQKLRNCAILMLALAVNIFWGKLIFWLFKAEIVQTDSFLAATTLQIAGYSPTLESNIIRVVDDHSISVIGACSAFENISMALLALISISFIRNARLSRNLWPWTALMVVAVIMLNSIRLSLLSLSAEHNIYWHDGQGAIYLGWVQTTMVLTIAILATRSTPATPPTKPLLHRKSGAMS